MEETHDLELALNSNQSKLVLDLGKKIITTTTLEKKLSMRILKYVFEVRNKSRSNDLAFLRSNKMTSNAVGEYLSNQRDFCRSHSIEFLDVVRLLLCNQTIDLKTEEGCELLHRTVAAGDLTLATMLMMQADVDVDVRDPANSRTLLHAVLRSCNTESNAKKEEFARLLLDQGAKVNSRCGKGHSVLYYAIKHSRCSSQLVEELLKRGAAVEKREGGHLLWTAVKEGQHEIAAMLIGSGAQLDLVAKSDHHTILQEVLRSHRIENTADREQLVRLILERGVNVNARDDNNYRALDDAAGHHHCSFRLVEELLERGARLQKFQSGEHLWAAIEKGNEDMIAKLVRSGVDLSVCKGDYSDTTPLLAVLRSTKNMNSIMNSNVKREQIVRLMLDSGADVNAYDSIGSVLSDAIRHSHCSSRLVEEILSYGALPFFKDIRLAAHCKPRLLPKLVGQQVPNDHGYSKCSYASEESRNIRAGIALELLIVNDYDADRMTDVTRAVEEILCLDLAASTLENLWGERPGSLLNLALKSEKRDVIKLLLKYGADPQVKDDLGYTPLFQATAFEDSEISRLLIEKGASVHACNDDGWSPIYGACMHESWKNCHLLLDMDADMNVVDSNGNSPLDGIDLVKLSDAGRLVIRYFALLVAKGTMVNDKDMASIMNHVRCRSHYEKCTKEIEQMKITRVCSGVPYFALFKINTFRILQQMRNPSLVSNFKQNSKIIPRLFPLYHKILLNSLNIVKIRYKLFRQECVYIQNAFEGLLPDLVVQKIAHYSTLERVKPYQQNYYLSLHQNLCNTKAV